jgi:hypothetical protein
MTERTKPQPDGATIISAEVLAAHRDLKLAERALAGDIPSAVEWLSRFGGVEWRRQIDD